MHRCLPLIKSADCKAWACAILQSACFGANNIQLWFPARTYNILIVEFREDSPCISQDLPHYRFQAELSTGISASPSSQSARPPQRGSLHAEHSSASVGMAAVGPHLATPLHASHKHDLQAGQDLGALYHRAEGSQQADQSASEQAGAGVGSWTEQEARDQPGSTAATSSAQAGGGDTPKTLQLKALAAQAERLRQVGLAGPTLHESSLQSDQHTWRLLQLW